MLRRPRRALLLSRTPRHPRPGTPWVRAAVEAARKIAAADEALVTGLGRDPYDVALAASRQAGGAAIVVLDRPPDAALGAAVEALCPARRLLVWPRASPERPAERRSAPARRDALIGELADRAYAVWVRKGGNMQALAEALRRRGCPVEDFGFSISDFGLKRERMSTAAIQNQKSKIQNDFPGWPYLTHYTREPDGAWPDESRGAYAAWLAHGPREDRREAFETLGRILSARRVLGSGRLMPGRASMVSFTARPPWELNALLKWRRGLRRWTFRPYGLAVRGEVLRALGARPVRYLPVDELAVLPPAERAFAQKHDPPETDWSGEAEWRLPGDLKLNVLPREALLALTSSREEALRLECVWGIACISLCT